MNTEILSFEELEQYKKSYRLAQLNSSTATAKALGIADVTLRRSRSTGYLFGVKAPKHIKLGSTIRYRAEDIISWVMQNECEEMEGL